MLLPRYLAALPALTSASLALALALLTPLARAASFYDEDSSGDLSNFGSAPTALLFTSGANIVTGTMGGPPDADPDIFTFTIQPGWALTSIHLAPLTPPERSFYAIASGSTIATDSSAGHLASYLTYEVGELMPILAASGNFGGTGFTAPLGAGTYTAWFQEISARVDYTFTYTVTAVPEPASAATLAALAGLALAATRRRRA